MKFGKRILIAAAMMTILVAGSSMSAKAAKFNPVFYAAKYADVKAALGTDATTLYNHYITFGQKEGRMPDANVAGGTAVDGIIESSAKFDPVFYAAKYADVKAAFGSDQAALYNHYITFGQKEGRMPFTNARGGEPVTGIATAQEIRAARTPVTYYVKYVGGDWLCQTGGNGWQENALHRELYYLKQSIKDGDLLVVDGAGQGLNLTLPVSLNNVTFIGSGSGIITANSIENVYVLKDCTGIVNGNVTNAYVFDNALANFNDSVTNLYVIKASTNEQTIAVAGTVDYLETSMNGSITRQLYYFRRNSFRMDKGTLKTSEFNYSNSPVY